jgi:hypothetical protein
MRETLWDSPILNPGSKRVKSVNRLASVPTGAVSKTRNLKNAVEVIDIRDYLPNFVVVMPCAFNWDNLIALYLS